MLSSEQWARDFTVSDDDIDFISGILLERETPLSTAEITRAIIERQLELERDNLREQYKNVTIYSTARSYDSGQKVLFPALDGAIGNVTTIRAGNNPLYGDYQVISVAFEDEEREFAAELTADHVLNSAVDEDALPGMNSLTTDDILNGQRDNIEQTVHDALASTPDLTSVTGKWYSRGLLLDVNEGHLHLAEAILDMMSGGPLSAHDILDQIGGLGSESLELQAFCLNYALNQDGRFDEVGPLDNVLWFLKRLEPAEVQSAPPMLRYQALQYDASLLTTEQRALEIEIADEWSEIDVPPTTRVQIALTYPHRRAGTLPLNAPMRHIFPTARKSPRIAVTLVDGQTGAEYAGWVVRGDRYVYGLSEMFTEHKLPIGTYLYIERQPDTDKIIVNFDAHRARTEWVPLITVKNGQMVFESQRRPIGAEFDPLLLLGSDDIAALDALFEQTQKQRKSLSAMLKPLVAELSRSSMQGNVHVKTLYSALNVVRRVPPAPICATLNDDPDFEYVGSHYWKLSS